MSKNSEIYKLMSTKPEDFEKTWAVGELTLQNYNKYHARQSVRKEISRRLFC